jgi:hypothetical protein
MADDVGATDKEEQCRYRMTIEKNEVTEDSAAQPMFSPALLNLFPQS